MSKCVWSAIYFQQENVKRILVFLSVVQKSNPSIANSSEVLSFHFTLKVWHDVCWGLHDVFVLWSSAVIVEVNLVQLFLKFKPLLKQKSECWEDFSVCLSVLLKAVSTVHRNTWLSYRLIHQDILFSVESSWPLC